MKLVKTTLIPEELVVEEALFHTANGYLGVRGNFEEGYAAGTPTIRGAYINGYYDNVVLKYPEKLYGFPEEAQRMVNLPDVQTVQLFADGEAFSLFTGRVLAYTRTLDTDAGTATRRVQWQSPGGKIWHLCFVRMASFVRPQLFFTRIEVELPAGGAVEVRSEVHCDVANFADEDDPRVASERQRHIFFDGAALLQDGGVARCHTGAARLAMAVCQRHTAQGADIKTELTPAGFTTTVGKTLAPGGVLQVDKYTLLSDARRTEDPAVQVQKLAAQCVGIGADALLAEQAAHLQKFWANSRVRIQGSDEIAEGMEYNLYMLLQSAGHDAVSNVAAKGLSGEGYEGHYFWDTEIYIFPFFVLTQPQLAQKLLDFRYNVLDGARRHARLLGHARGALYPWRTIAGSECSAYYPSGSAQYHITGDVAHSLMQYYLLTGDDEYMAEKGLEILLETARLWLCVGHYNRAGRFCIQDVTGPDEYTCIVNNNYYTNLIAKHNLMAAAQVYNHLNAAGKLGQLAQKIGFEEGELAAFEKAAAAMYLPHNKELGITPQDDSFLEKPVWDFAATPAEHYPLLLHYFPLTLYRHQVCKQADTVLAHYLFEDDTDEETMRRSYEYYEKITTHDSSLSACIFSIMAARLGMPEKAYAYFLKTVRTDLDNAHKNTKDGIHTANMGGAYLCVVAGFAGLRIKQSGLHFAFTLPKQWQGYNFKVWYRRSLIEVQVRRGAATFVLEEGPPCAVYVNGNRVEIDTQVTVNEVLV